jgi:hypothetical protein
MAGMRTAFRDVKNACGNPDASFEFKYSRCTT